MRDPEEGLDGAGRLVTGARRERVPGPYEPLLAEAADAIDRAGGAGVEGLHLTGSVATGQARPPTSDLDLLVVLTGSPATARTLHAVGEELAERHRDLVADVDLTVVTAAEVDADDARGLGLRALLRHHAVVLSGHDRAAAIAPVPCSATLAWGLAADARPRLERLLAAAGSTTPSPLGLLARRGARTALLAAAMLASVRQGTWTTDRDAGADWLGRSRQDLVPVLRQARAWADHPPPLDRAALEGFLADLLRVVAVVEAGLAPASR